MKAYEHTDYLASIEAASLLLDASSATNFVRFESKDGRALHYLPYLPPNYSLYPASELLGESYGLKEFSRMAAELGKLTGEDCEQEVLKIWTLAYYTGNGSVCSEDVYLATDGVNFQMPPLMNYLGSFCRQCDYEELKPPRRAFQCYWHFFSQNRGRLHEQPPYIQQAIAHFTESRHYR